MHHTAPHPLVPRPDRLAEQCQARESFIFKVRRRLKQGKYEQAAWHFFRSLVLAPDSETATTMPTPKGIAHRENT